MGFHRLMSPFLWEHLRGWAEAEHSFVCQCEDVTMWGDLDCFIGDSCRSWFSSVTSGATARPSVLWCASLTVPCCAVSIPGARLRNVEVRKATWDLKHLQSGDGKSSSLRFYFCCVCSITFVTPSDSFMEEQQNLYQYAFLMYTDWTYF